MVYTVRFGGRYFTTGGTHEIFRASAGYTWILRDLLWSIGDTPTTHVIIWIDAGQSGPLYLVRDLAPQPEVVGHLELRQELLVGDLLMIASDATNFSVAATGYRFTGENPRTGLLPAEVVAATHN